MAFFAWKDEYSVGIKKFDEQHKRIVGYLNELYDAMTEGKGKEVLGGVLNGLLEYTGSHFLAEESLMKLHKYPGYEEHRIKHQKMAQRVTLMIEKFNKGEISSPIQITNFLKDWLGKHIMKTDKAYAPFLKTKGVV